MNKFLKSLCMHLATCLLVLPLIFTTLTYSSEYINIKEHVWNSDIVYIFSPVKSFLSPFFSSDDYIFFFFFKLDVSFKALRFIFTLLIAIGRGKRVSHIRHSNSDIMQSEWQGLIKINLVPT